MYKTPPLLVSLLLVTGVGCTRHNNRLIVPPPPTMAPSMTIESFVRSHIHDLSPIKEQLGGTFYITAFTVHDATGSVSYEDGHNAYTSDFVYNIDMNGNISVQSFTIR